ncbi:MAG: IclR family transcriptional regulator [Paracoccus sp. (in: a-proteobacteria)]|nr:IclR family transcriptional regulator [Paracoccus sp. (in: a-proteobacteria)]
MAGGRADAQDTVGQGPRYRAPALDKGLDIIEILAASPQPMTRAGITREMGRSASEAYRMLERLVARGYVTRIDGTDGYALTMKLFLLAHAHPPLRRLAVQAQPLMDRFAAGTRQSCHLVVPDSRCAVVIAQASPAAHWEFRIRVGAQLDLFSTGSGLTLLAFQPAASRAATLASWGVDGADQQLAAVADHLDAIRAAGHRAAPSRQLVGVEDLSVPVIGPGGDAFAVVTCANIRHPDEAGDLARAATLERLLALAQDLSPPVA